MITRTYHGPPLPTTFVTAASMRALGERIVQRIRRRTESGAGVNGAFAALSPGYAKRKAKAGLGSMADLTVSGAMLNDLQVTNVAPDGSWLTIGWVR
jgi:hypothetical protein